MEVFNFEAEYESLRCQTRNLLFLKSACDPDDFREQSALDHALELAKYRLLKYACDSIITTEQRQFIKLIETILPEVSFHVPDSYKRHVICSCVSKKEREEAEVRRRALAELVMSAPLANIVEETSNVLGVVDESLKADPIEEPFSDRLRLTPQDVTPEEPFSVAVPDDCDVDEVGIIHHDENVPITDDNEWTIQRENLNTIHNSVIGQKTKLPFRTNRRFRGVVSDGGSTLTVVRRDGSTLCTLKMKCYGSGAVYSRIPVSGTNELRELDLIVRWWERHYYVPPSVSSLADLADRAYVSASQVEELSRLMV